MSDSSTPENSSNYPQLTPPSEPGSPQRSRLSRLWLPLAVGAAVAASGAAVAIAATNSNSTNPSPSPHPALSTPSPGQGQGANPSPWPYGSGSGGGNGSPSPYGNSSGGTSGSLSPSTASAPPAGTDIAKYLGQRLAGNGQESISLARAEELGDQVPAGAQVDTATRTIRFSTEQVSFVVLASPPQADMKFRTAGIDDPEIIVPPGAHITLEFINGDNDEAHMWLLQTGDPGAASAGNGAHVTAAPPLGDPTSAGQQAETISFSAPAPGTYHYDCPFPGHAAQGMYGRFVVQGS
jgi:plastocyanin